MILPPTGGPPPKGAAVRGRMEPLGPLKHMAADVKLKHCWERQEGSPGVTISRITPYLPQRNEAAQAPKQRVQHLTQNGYHSRSLSLSIYLLASLGIGTRYRPRA